MDTKFALGAQVRIDGSARNVGEVVKVDGDFRVVAFSYGRELVHVSLLVLA